MAPGLAQRGEVFAVPADAGKEATTDETKAAGEVVPPGNARTGPTAPGRSVCAPGSLPSPDTADQAAQRGEFP
jgi:hypothetical protein